KPHRRQASRPNVFMEAGTLMLKNAHLPHPIEGTFTNYFQTNQTSHKRLFTKHLTFHNSLL
ncbi:MAG: hypothetical protein Q8R89_10295, partial [Desulfomicrobium sp.]|nr:hypothetical protein [Desulfomicrobium sp.]